MTTRVLISLACLGVLASPLRAQSAPSTAPGFVSEVMLQFESSMQKFIALSAAMPADKFGWSPGAGTMTVAKVYGHVARYNYLYPATSLGVKAPDGRDADAAEDLAELWRMLPQELMQPAAGLLCALLLDEDGTLRRQRRTGLRRRALGWRRGLLRQCGPGGERQHHQRRTHSDGGDPAAGRARGRGRGQGTGAGVHTS